MCVSQGLYIFGVEQIKIVAQLDYCIDDCDFCGVCIFFPCLVLCLFGGVFLKIDTMF